eukprot:1190626-Prorocentrum_minimum.AAC.5
MCTGGRWGDGREDHVVEERELTGQTFALATVPPAYTWFLAHQPAGNRRHTLMIQGVKVWRQASSVEKRLGSGPIIKTMVNTYLDRGELGAGGDRIVHKNNTWGAWHQSGLYTEQNLQLRNAA